MASGSLMKDQRFWPLFWTQFLSAVNDNFLKNSIVMMITFKSLTVWGLSAEKMVALCGALFISPFFLFSATAGQLADKHEKSSVIKVIKVIEIFLMLIAGYGFVTEKYGLLIGILFLMGLHSTFFGPLKYSILPQLVKDRELVAANALVELGTFVAILAGTIGGGLAAGWQPTGNYLVAGSLIALAIVGYFTSTKIQKAPPHTKDVKIDLDPFRPTLEIYRFTKKTHSVFLSVLGISWFWFFGGAMLSLLPTYSKSFLGGNENILTMFLTIFTVGIGVGSILCEKLSFEQLELGLVPLGSIGITLFTFDLYLVGQPYLVQNSVGIVEFLSMPHALRITLDLLFISIFSGFMIVPLYTFIQHRSETSHRSRIIAGNNILNALFMVISAFMVMTMYAIGLTIPQMFLVLALLNAVVAGYIYLVIPEFLLRFFAWILVRILYRLKTVDLDQLPRTGPVLLVCNHVSFVDWLFIAGAIQRPVRFVMDHNYAKIPFFKYLVQHAKVIPISSRKEDPALVEKAFAQVSHELRNGEVVCIFPEGKLTRDGNLNPFRPGIEQIIKTDPVPVVPLALIGLWGSFFSHRDGIFRTNDPKVFSYPVTLRAGSAIPPEKVSAAHLQTVVQDLLKVPPSLV